MFFVCRGYFNKSLIMKVSYDDEVTGLLEIHDLVTLELCIAICMLLRNV